MIFIKAFEWFFMCIRFKNLTLDVAHKCKKLSCKKTCKIEFLKPHFDIFCVYARKKNSHA